MKEMAKANKEEEELKVSMELEKKNSSDGERGSSSSSDTTTSRRRGMESRGGGKKRSLAVFENISRINHSCAPNCMVGRYGTTLS